jgi:hypothetical protein
MPVKKVAEIMNLRMLRPMLHNMLVKSSQVLQKFVFLATEQFPVGGRCAMKQGGGLEVAPFV